MKQLASFLLMVACLASSGQLQAANAGSISTGWGPLEHLVGHEWTWSFLDFEWSGSTSFVWEVPGRVIVDGEGMTYEQAADGSIIAKFEGGEEPVERVMTVRADGSLLSYIEPEPGWIQFIRAEDKRSVEIWRTEPSGQVSVWYKGADGLFPSLGRVFRRADGATGSSDLVGPQLRFPDQWGPLARLVNRTTGETRNNQHIAHRVAADGDALYTVYPSETGGSAAWLIRRMSDGSFVRKTMTTGLWQFRLGYLVDASTIRWYLPGRSEPEQDWIVRQVDDVLDKWELEVLPYDPGLAAFTQPVRTLLYPDHFVTTGVEQVAGLDVDLAGAVQRIAREYIDVNTHKDHTNPWARVLYDGLSGGLQVARESEARSRAQLDATVASMQAAAVAEPAGVPGNSEANAPTPSTGVPVAMSQQPGGYTVDRGMSAEPAQTPEPAAAKPLRFVLMIGMKNLPNDAHNSMCYSNVITRPGPPGWGASGFLPSGSAEQALEEINALKGEFIAACRRSGRDITSEGDFTHVRNQNEGDEQRVQSTRPRFQEDVSVVLD